MSVTWHSVRSLVVVVVVVVVVHMAFKSYDLLTS
jgi:DMSO/TMAO reductase YedYZ heme-binding membrane subunit